MPTHQRPIAEGETNVSRVLLPDSPDPALEDWSTLATRKYRNQPVNAAEPSGTDFFSLQVRFGANIDLFTDLHRAANWVVTLDAFVGREQIDALKDGPDVLTVRPGIGKNRMYTLVVSSMAGREWIVRLLTKRLTDDLGLEAGAAQVVASKLYAVGRQSVPALMLRAIGPGRFLEEIIGLVLARFGIREEDDNDFDGFEYWISLDEHTSWFGGPQTIRPDLLRVRACRTNGATEIDLLVVESKFRPKFDLDKAEVQVSRAVASLRRPSTRMLRRLTQS